MEQYLSSKSLYSINTPLLNNDNSKLYNSFLKQIPNSIENRFEKEDFIEEEIEEEEIISEDLVDIEEVIETYFSAHKSQNNDFLNYIKTESEFEEYLDVEDYIKTYELNNDDEEDEIKTYTTSEIDLEDYLAFSKLENEIDSFEFEEGEAKKEDENLEFKLAA